MDKFFSFITSCLVWIFFTLFPYTISGTQITVEELNFSSSSVHIKASIHGSAIVFQGFSYDIKNENLYVVVRGGLANDFNHNGTIQIDITDTRLANVTHVYIKNGSELVEIFNT